MSRVAPLEPPYEADVEARLSAMIPPGVPPIALFRTFARNMPMAAAMDGWGHYELSKRLSLTLRDREIVIDRTAARCKCEYEWGVHVAFLPNEPASPHPRSARSPAATPLIPAGVSATGC